MNIKQFFLSSLFIIFFTSCVAITGHKDSMDVFNNKLETKDCDYKRVEEKIKDGNDIILWGIEGGSLARNCFDYKKSNELFDKAEEEYKQNVDMDSIFDNTLEQSSSILVNNNVNEYEGNIYERIMLNTYKALNFASLGDDANARVEFNRALDRQRRAKEYYEEEIKQKKEELSQNNQHDKLEENKEAQDIVYKEYADLFNNFEAYPDFVNPFTTYISGIYFLLSGDSIKARDLLKESLSMDSTNEQIKSDYELSKKYITSLKKSKDNYAWIVYENGKGMIKNETIINVPLFLFSRNVVYSGISLPKIFQRDSSYEYLDVNGERSFEICNMDSVIKTEFKKRFPFILTESLVNTISKTITQKQLYDSNALAGFLGVLYQTLTNRADVRSWTALPKNFQSLRVKLDGNPLEIKNNQGRIIKEILIPNDKNALIYVKSQEVGNDIVHKILF